MNGAYLLIIAGVCLLFSSFSAQAETVSGRATLVDGDTLRIGDVRVRLIDIDAPETGQRCRNARNRDYKCGVKANDALRGLIGTRSVTCRGEFRDDYGRLLAICFAGDVELNRAMVKRGWAVRYGNPGDKQSRYLNEELEAAKERRGIWQRGPDGFEDPKTFRAARWNTPDPKAPPGCPIKGNISNRNGVEVRIYHTPWSQYYGRTRINTRKGERWFCDEAEALRAGWRAPYR